MNMNQRTDRIERMWNGTMERIERLNGSDQYFTYLPSQQATSNKHKVSIHHLYTHTVVLININIACMIQS